MTWRDDVEDRARNGDVDGVLKIFDHIIEDRNRVRSLNDAYLLHITELAKGKTVGPVPTEATVGGAAVLEAAARARAAATDARKAATASVGAP